MLELLPAFACHSNRRFQSKLYQHLSWHHQATSHCYVKYTTTILCDMILCQAFLPCMVTLYTRDTMNWKSSKALAQPSQCTYSPRMSSRCEVHYIYVGYILYMYLGPSCRPLAEAGCTVCHMLGAHPLQGQGHVVSAYL